MAPGVEILHEGFGIFAFGVSIMVGGMIGFKVMIDLLYLGGGDEVADGCMALSDIV